MPCTRDGFVPLGDVSQAVALPGDRALTHRADASPARRPFTRLDQVTQLVQASEADPEVGFMARLLALCSLPRTTRPSRAARDGETRRRAGVCLRIRGIRRLPAGIFLSKTLEHRINKHQRQGTHAAPQSDGPALSRFGDVDVRRRAESSVHDLTHHRCRRVLVEPEATR